MRPCLPSKPLCGCLLLGSLLMSAAVLAMPVSSSSMSQSKASSLAVQCHALYSVVAQGQWGAGEQAGYIERASLMKDAYVSFSTNGTESALSKFGKSSDAFQSLMKATARFSLRPLIGQYQTCQQWSDRLMATDADAREGGAWPLPASDAVRGTDHEAQAQEVLEFALSGGRAHD